MDAGGSGSGRGEGGDADNRWQTNDLEAYQLYLQGRHYLNQHIQSGYAKAVECFDKAINRDAGYAMPHVGLADAYAWMGYVESARPIDVYPKARDAAEKALELDESIGEAHAALGMVLTMYDWEWSRAGAEVTRALELAPQSAATLEACIVYFGNLGRFDEAFTLAKRAVEIDPLWPKAHQNLGYYYYLARRFDEAEVQLNKARDLDPHFPHTHACLGFLYIAQERFDRAVAALDQAAELAAESPAYLAPPSTLVGKPVHVGSVRSLVLLILQGVYPRGLKSSAIREKGRSESSYDINPNTLSVTLARLKSDGLVRIEGKTWFLVPKEIVPLIDSGETR